MAMDYESKWVEAIPTTKNNCQELLISVIRYIFAQYKCPRTIISYGGSHFNNAHFCVLLKKYGVHHCVTDETILITCNLNMIKHDY